VKKTTWAAIQMSSQDDVAQNLSRASELVRRAKDRGAEVCVLPENFALMSDEADKVRVAEVVPDPPTAALGPILGRLASIAKELAVWIVAGGFPERSSDEARPFNSCLVLSPAGELTARYRKVHLFDVDLADGSKYRESAATSAGAERVLAEIAGAKVGLSVCYDLRFPELYRGLSAEGAEVLVVPAAFTLQTGKDHWAVLLRARAIENQCWVVAAAQWGRHPRGRNTYGKSMIVDPWGDVIAQAGEGEGVCVGELDPECLERVRTQLPALRHKRLL